MTSREQRPAARILLLDPDERILLFRFHSPDRPPFWCTPGGAVDPGETYAAAARRELVEECGVDIDCGAEVAQRFAQFETLEHVLVEADERYFCVRIDRREIDDRGHTELERNFITEWRWFARGEIAEWTETIYPLDLVNILEGLEENL